MADEKYGPEVLMHKGRQTKIVYIGGDYNGEIKQMRAPINPVVEVAKPPKYLGDHHYEASPAGIGYQRYHLRELDGIKYYVWSEWLITWDTDPSLCMNREYETDNQRAMRLEEEQKEKEREEKERQKELARKDFETLGIAIEHRIHGRLDPRDVRIFINHDHPDAQRRFFKRDKL